jgi:hypothetical protein
VSARRRTTEGTLAIWFALFAVLLLQPQAAVHYAMSEEHASAEAGGHAHHTSDEVEHRHTGSGQADHRDCDVCFWANAAPSPPRVAASLVQLQLRGTEAVLIVVHSVRAEKTLRPGDRVRAPPRRV